jgi:hypothetical protein
VLASSQIYEVRRARVPRLRDVQWSASFSADIVSAMTTAAQFKTRSTWATRVEIAGFALTAVIFGLYPMSVTQAIAWVCVLGGATVSASFLIRGGLKWPE